MATKNIILRMPRFRRYIAERRQIYLSKDVVLEGKEPKIYITRWDADAVLREIERQCNIPETLIQLPSLYDSYIAVKQDPELRESIFSFPAEWQSTLILNPNGPPETDSYVLMDDQERVLKKSRKARSLTPKIIFKERDNNIILADVFDVPFELQDLRYNPEDLDPDTGFFERLNSDGKYGISFGLRETLYSVLLNLDGNVICSWEPSLSNPLVGIRGCYIGNQYQELPEELLEKEIDVFQSKYSRERAEILTYVKNLESHYRHLVELIEIGLEQIETLKKKIQGQ